MRGWSRFLSRWQNIVGLVIIAFFFIVAVAAPWIAPPPTGEDVNGFLLVKSLKGNLPISPNSDALLGTVATGIMRQQLDVYYTLVWGTRSALRFGIIAAFSTAVIGVFIGAVSAFWGGWVDMVLMRITDAFLAFPIIAGVVFFERLLDILNEYYKAQQFITEGPARPLASPNVLQVLFGAIDPVMLALILFSWMPYARMTNALVQRIKRTEFVQASRALGAGSLRLVFRHMLPNSLSPSIVMATSSVGGMVLMQATLAFIGLGSGSEWGNLLTIGRRWILGLGGNPLVYWWVFLPITLALVLFGVGWNLLGDGVNDWLNPRDTG